jgi:galactitol PTS system EIIB component
MRTILVVCGTGVATASVVAGRIRGLLDGAGAVATVRQGKLMDLLGPDLRADLIVSTVPVPDELGIPVMSGAPFLTGDGAEQAGTALLAFLDRADD